MLACRQNTWLGSIATFVESGQEKGWGRFRPVGYWLPISREFPYGRQRLKLKGNFENTWQCDFVRLPKSRHPNRDFRLPHVQAKRAMQPIPKCQSAGPIRVRFLFHNRVMNAMHPGRHNEPVQPPLPRDWQFD